jgi:DNA-binding NarL/FixJ family response regulator
MDETIKVLVADDHPLIRTGIRNILNRAPGIKVVGEAVDGEHVFRLVEQTKPDVLVLDMEMPTLTGVDVARKLRSKGDSLPILALSAHEDKQFIMGMLETGAAGYLVKDEVPETLVRAIRGVARGESGWVSQRIATRIAIWLQGEDHETMHLSKKEIRLLRLFLIGKSNQEIAEILQMDEADVENCLRVVVKTVRHQFNHKPTHV